MDSIDLATLESLARKRYEWARARRAMVGLAPVFAVAAVSASLSRHPLAAIAFGLASFLVGATMLWYGRGPKRAVVPGVLAGLVPLVVALCAVHVGHRCAGDGCMMLCVPACFGGGIAAGILVAVIALRRGAGLAYWACASGLAVLVGAMGCACAGAPGLLGLVLGYGLGTAPVLIARALRASSS